MISKITTWKLWKESRKPLENRKSMIMDWVNRYCTNDSLTERNLWTQCHINKNLYAILYRYRKRIKIHKRPQSYQDSQVNLGWKEYCWRHCHAWHQVILRNHSNEKSTIPGQTRLVHQWIKGLNYNATQLEPPEFFTKMLRILMGERTISLTNSSGKLVST